MRAEALLSDRCAFYDVGIQGSLRQEIGLAQLRRNVFEHPDELLSDDLAFRLRVGHAGKLLQESIRGVGVHQVQPQIALERSLDPLRLFQSQEPVIDEDASQLVADGLVQQDGRHRRVHSAGQGAYHPAIAHLFADPVDGVIHEVAGSPRAVASAYPEEKILQHGLAHGCMTHFRMELQPEYFLAVSDGCYGRVLGVCQGREVVGKLLHPVAVTHPHLQRWRQPMENRSFGSLLVQDCRPELLFEPRRHLAAQLVHQRLHPVADAQNRQPPLETPSPAPAAPRARRRWPGLPIGSRPGGSSAPPIPKRRKPEQSRNRRLAP